MNKRYESIKLLETTDIPKIFNIKEVVMMLDIPVGTLYNMHYRKVLPCIKIGKRLKFTEEHIKQIIKKGGSLYGC